MKPIEGMIVPIVTPLDEQHQPDFHALRRVCEIQIQAGIDVIFVLGTTGEFYGLSQRQQRQVVETALETANGRVGVIAGVSGHSTQVSLEALRDYAGCGLSAYVSSTPYFMRYSQNELVNHFRVLSDAAKEPIVLYNYPDRYGHRIDIESIRELLDDKRVFGIKDTDGNFEYMCQLLELKKAFPEFRVFEGALPNLARSGRLGLDGSVQALANLLPVECASLWRQIDNGQWESLDIDVARMWTFHQEIQAVDGFIQAMKACMSLRKWCGATTALPMQPIGTESLRRLRDMMDRTYPSWTEA
ncbi:MAG: dihydrodipicolinate synthase family protein [Acidimicrobiia bacterium]|nr:dihydrodipicolinate synthase family protein [Acidimicrobiia bacterium]